MCQNINGFNVPVDQNIFNVKLGYTVRRDDDIDMSKSLQLPELKSMIGWPTYKLTHTHINFIILKVVSSYFEVSYVFDLDA